MYKFSEQAIGEFVEKDCGKYFTYSKTSNAWALQQGFEHEIDVLDGVRYGNVKKTVAYIAIDEDADGNPVLEKWHLKKNTEYKNNA